MSPYLTALLGVFCAAAGAELFVRGSVGLAAAARVPPVIIAATIAAFATSSPEVTVAIVSGLAGESEISFGNVLGGNVVNLTLVLGVTLTLGPLAFERGNILRNYFVAGAAPIAFAFMLRDGEISRFESAALVASFVIWLVVVLRDGSCERQSAGPGEANSGIARAGVEAIAGLIFLVAAGKLIVSGAEQIARALGLSEFVIGSTVVAIGTSTPELATAIISRLRKHDEIGVGTLFGSNIFNAFCIVGIAGGISPIRVPIWEAAPALLLGVAASFAAFPPRNGVYPVWRGYALLLCYATYLVVTAAVER